MIEPVLREKKRYLVFEVDKHLSFEAVNDSIIKSCLAFLGEKGLGEAGLILLKELWTGNKGVIRIANNRVNEVKTCLGLVKDFNTKTLKTTGTIKKAKQLVG